VAGEKPLIELDGPAGLCLLALREYLQLSQAQIASATGLAQSQIMRLDHKRDCKLSTLERYVAGVGGELEVVARFGPHRVSLLVPPGRTGTPRG